jgi:hypothetical protein
VGESSAGFLVAVVLQWSSRRRRRPPAEKTAPPVQLIENFLLLDLFHGVILPPMSGEAEILGTPPLRKKWKDAKQKAQEAAKKTKETPKLDALQKNTLKESLGPDLDAWPKLYPDWTKLQAGKSKIDSTITTYETAIKNSGLSENIRKLMTAPLTEIKTEMAKRLEKAHELVSSDLKAATKASKKAIPPIVLVQHEVAHLVAEKAGATRLKPVRIYLEIILSDDKVLKNVPAGLDNGLLAQKIHDRVGFASLIEDLAHLLKTVDKMEVDAAEAKFEAGMDEIIHKVLDRAAEPILELVKVRSEYRMYKVKKGATLALATGGVVASIASLAASPFTGGVSTVAGIIGLFKAVSTLMVEANNLAMGTEEFIGKVTEDLRTLYKQYKKASETVVGVGEIAKVTANSLIGPWITTIKSAKEGCEQAESKNNGLIVKANDEAEKLGQVLTKQEVLYQQLRAYEESNKKLFSPEEVAALLKIQKGIETTAKSVQSLIEAVSKLHGRTEHNKGALVMLHSAMAQLAAKEPTWSKVGQMVAQVAVSAGLMIAGGVNVPEPMECMKLTKEIAENAGRVLESLESVKDLIEGFNDMLKKHKK